MRKLLASAALLTAALFAPAAPAADPVGPAVEIRIRSVNDLLEYGEYLGDLAGQGEQVKQGVAFARAITNAKTGLEGIDPNRPIGGYALVTPDVVNSPLVLVLPVADEEMFGNLLKKRLSLDVQGPTDGVYEIAIPNFPLKVFGRFAHKSAYLTVRDAKNLDPKTLVPPGTLFADKDPAVASVKLHVDRIPADVRKTVFGEMEMAAAQLKTRKFEGETDALTKLKPVGLDAAVDALHAFFHEAQTVSARVLVDPKTDDLTAELSLTAKSGSALAKLIRTVGNKPGTAGKLPAASNPLASFHTRLALPESVRDKLKPGVDALLDELVEKSDPNGRDFVKMILDALAPTVLAGELELGVQATGPDAKGTLGIAACLKMKEAKAVEKLLLKFAPFVPEDEAKFDLLEDKVNGVSLHRITLTNEEQTKKFGTDTVWVGVGDGLLVVTLEAKDGKVIKGIVASDARKVPMVGGEVAISRLLPLLNADKNLTPDQMKKLLASTVGKDSAGKDTVKLTLDGGDALTLRLSMKGEAVKFLVGIDKANKANPE
jgi:hypothetical protein